MQQFENESIEYHWMCIPIILSQFEGESIEYHWMCIPNMTGSCSMTRAHPEPEIRPMCGNNASRLRPMQSQVEPKDAIAADAQQALEGQRAAEAPLAWSQAARVADTQWAVKCAETSEALRSAENQWAATPMPAAGKTNAIA